MRDSLRIVSPPDMQALARAAEYPADTLRADAPAPVPADSPARTAADSLGAATFAGPAPADSMALDTLPAAAPPVSAERLFGEASQLVVPRMQSFATEQTAAGAPLFQGFVVLLAAAYLLFVTRNPNHVVQLLSRTFHRNAGRPRLFDSHGGSLYAGFQRKAILLGLLAAGTVAVRHAGPWLGGMPFPPVVVALGSALLLAAVFGAEAALLETIGAVTLARDTLREIIGIKQGVLAWGAIVLTPTLVLAALCPADKVWLLTYIAGGELIATAWLFLQKSGRFFLSKKISILHWFLYLCIIEIFPISLLWLLPARI